MPPKRTFALKLIPLFAVSGFVLYRQHAFAAQIWIGFGVCLILVGWVWPKSLAPLQQGMERLGFALRSWMTRLLLEALYFLILTPLAWLARRTGKQFLDLTFHSETPSYFIRREKKPEPSSYEKGW